MARLESWDMPPKERTIQLPPDLKARCWYQVLVSFRRGNPCHCALLYTGFLNGRDNGPGGYHYLTNPTWDRNGKLEDVHYLEVLKELGELT